MNEKKIIEIYSDIKLISEKKTINIRNKLEKRNVLKTINDSISLLKTIYNKIQRKNSKNKGNSFERQIAKQLSLFLSKGERDDLVWRNTSSGARFTNRFKKGMQTENQSGDISYTHELSIPFFTKFNVECKAYQDIKLWSI
jgi:hypothetical protein